MHSNGYTAAPERKRRSMSRVLAASAALLAVAVLLLVLSIVQSRTAAVRNRREGELGVMTVDQLAEKMRFEVDNKIV